MSAQEHSQIRTIQQGEIKRDGMVGRTAMRSSAKMSPRAASLASMFCDSTRKVEMAESAFIRRLQGEE
jgi:hypothetical protein